MTTRCLQGMLAIEYFATGAQTPDLMLEQHVVQQLNQQISQELQAIIPHLDDSTYAIVGGLYQSCEILQPGFPIHSQLRQYANAALKGENNRRNQLVIGAKDGKLPKGLRHNKDVELTPLLLIPFVILTENDTTKREFEQQLMHKGMASVDLLKHMQQAIEVKIRHINFMTVLDLAAMMHNHLQMAGFESLWKLLEQALFNQHPETKVTTTQHNEFYLSKKIVFTPFFSYLMWCDYGSGKNLDDPQQAYLHYTQVQRQYVATLLQHGLDVRQFVPTRVSWPTADAHICFATLDQSRIHGDFYHEIVQPINADKTITIDKNEHSHLGVLFYQVSDNNGGLEFYYPLNTTGIREIEKILVSS